MTVNPHTMDKLISVPEFKTALGTQLLITYEGPKHKSDDKDNLLFLLVPVLEVWMRNEGTCILGDSFDPLICKIFQWCYANGESLP